MKNIVKISSLAIVATCMSSCACSLFSETHTHNHNHYNGTEAIEKANQAVGTEDDAKAPVKCSEKK